MERVWNRRTPLHIRLRLWWQLTRPIPADEFHPCLNMDTTAMMYMCWCERGRYGQAMLSRRARVHDREFVQGSVE
jgi:hypothetical protein